MDAVAAGRETTAGRRLVLAAAALVLIAGLAVVVGVPWHAIARELLAADPLLVGLALAASLLAQLLWAEATATVLRTVDPGVSSHRVRLGYLTGTFLKQILPFGHAGGVPLLSYVLSEDNDLAFRPTLGAVTASELLNFLASLAVVALGLFWLALTAGLGDDPALGGPGPGLALGAGLAVVLTTVLGGRAVLRRQRFTRLCLGVAAVGRPTVGRVLPGISRRLAPEAVERDVAGFFDAFGEATADRRILLRAAGLGLAGWLSFGLLLSLGFLAVGTRFPVALSLILVPAGGLATLLPTPGGLGGAEVGTAAAAVLLTGASVEVAAAAVLLYRVAAYWFVLAVGAGSSIYLSVGLTGIRPGD